MTSYIATVTKQAPEQVPEDFAAKPHHELASDGSISRFRNRYPSWDKMHDGPLFPIFLKVVRLLITGKISTPDTTPPKVAVRKPTFLTSRHGASAKLRATWLGHACYYVEFPSGLRVLFDPVFEDRCAPVQKLPLGPKRFSKPPCSIAEIPVVDAVVISHSHYDHLSSPSVNEVHKHHPNAHFFVGLGLAKWFRSSGIDKVTELDWWEDADLTLTPASTGSEAAANSVQSSMNEGTITARISCLPAQHSSGRTPMDKDTTLWCSWGVSSASPSPNPASPAIAKSVYFGGDTGYRNVPNSLDPTAEEPYPDSLQQFRTHTSEQQRQSRLPINPQFRQIGQLRGPFDLGLLPIGAYTPRMYVSSVHASPFDAVEIFRDTNCRRAMGIHWGTWALTFEDVLEPPLLLKEALKRRGIPETGVFDVCDVGESREF